MGTSFGRPRPSIPISPCSSRSTQRCNRRIAEGSPMSPYEFALLRYVHDLSAQEFANVGVILFDSQSRRLHMRVSERYGRISEFFRGVNGNAYRAMIRQVERSLSAVNQDLRAPNFLDQSIES